MKFTLPDDLRTGIDVLDAQHRELFSKVEQLSLAARRGQLQRASDMLGYLESYASSHFSTEELHMAAAGYQGLAAHRAAHRTFVTDLRARKDEFASSGSLASLMMSLCDWTAVWLEVHVREVDGAMAIHLRLSPP